MPTTTGPHTPISTPSSEHDWALIPSNPLLSPPPSPPSEPTQPYQSPPTSEPYPSPPTPYPSPPSPCLLPVQSATAEIGSSTTGNLCGCSSEHESAETITLRGDDNFQTTTSARKNSLQLPVQSVTVETDSGTIDNLRGCSSEHGSAETITLRGDDNFQTTTSARKNSLQLPVQSVTVETDSGTIDNLRGCSSEHGSAETITLRGDDGSQTTENLRENPFQLRLLHTVPIWLTDYDPDGEGYSSSAGEIPLYRTPSSLESLFATLQLLVDSDDLRDMLRFNPCRFFIELFFMKRFFSWVSRKYEPSDLWSLSQAWDAFMTNLQQIEASATRADGLVKWYAGFAKARSGFVVKTILGAQWNLHSVCMGFTKGCAVVEQQCPFCRPRGKKMTGEMRLSTNLLPPEIQVAINVLDDLISREEYLQCKRLRS